MKSRFYLAASALLFAVSVSHAELQNENLLVKLPEGYKIDFQQKKEGGVISEMVPTQESVKNWTEMVTVQIFFNLKRTPEQFRAQMEKLWFGSCANAETKGIGGGIENGYPTLMWMQSCPLNKATGKPEITWFKAVQGNDSFYLVQKAFKFAPAKEQVEQWTRYLGTVAVCDSRRAERACPTTN